MATTNYKIQCREGSTAEIDSSKHARERFYDTTLNRLGYYLNDGTTIRYAVTCDNSMVCADALTFNGAIIFNEAGADKDYRFEGSGDTHLIFLDGGNDRVGFGKSAPTAKVHISQAGGTALILEDTSAYDDTPNSILSFNGVYKANGTITEFARIEGIKENAVDDDYDGALIFYHRLDGGAITESVRCGSTETVVNEQSNDIDFRVEGNGNANCLTLDAGNDNITINAAAVSAHYDIMLAGDGVLGLKETATPTADTNYGKVYCKNDDKLYFQDGAGAEHEIAFVP